MTIPQLKLTLEVNMTEITVIKWSNYAQRRYERRAAFLAKKHQEAEQKCHVRSTE
ncbi:MAG TPA: hypothetical protein ACHBX0_12950 [Arsenophonus sp.]